MAQSKHLDRRQFMRNGSLALGAASLAPHLLCAAGGAAPQSKPDYTLKIQPTSLDIAPGVTIKTTAYNGQVPGPLLRIKEGVPVTIEVTNASAHPDIVHWHGLAIDSLNDGAMEEGSPMIAPGAQLRYTFTPRPTGTRWYHTHAGAGGTFPRHLQWPVRIPAGRREASPAHYDQEIFLAIHHWEPSFVPMVEHARASANSPSPPALTSATSTPPSTSHMLGAGEPIRVKQGQRVLLASAQCQRH